MEIPSTYLDVFIRDWIMKLPIQSYHAIHAAMIEKHIVEVIDIFDERCLINGADVVGVITSSPASREGYDFLREALKEEGGPDFD